MQPEQHNESVNRSLLFKRHSAQQLLKGAARITLIKVYHYKDTPHKVAHVRSQTNTSVRIRPTGHITIQITITYTRRGHHILHWLNLRDDTCRRFDPGGSLDRRVNCRRVSQPRWVGARRSTKGEETGKGETRGLRVALHPGRVRLQ